MPAVQGIIVGDKLTLSVSRGTLFEDVSFSFGSESRAALVGSNGTGKSSLLRVIGGEIEPDAGTITSRRGLVIQYIPQMVPDNLKGLSLAETLIANLAIVRPNIEEWQAYATLSQLGFVDNDFSRPLGTFSGGEANRVMLARALVVKPDFLLLDEPTNHMDSEAIVRFERLLQEEVKVPFCIVSHDRTLLDDCTNTTLFLRHQGLDVISLPYSKAVEELRQQDEARRDRRKAEQKEVERLEASAKRIRSWASKNSDLAPVYQSLLKRVERKKGEMTFIPPVEKRKLALEGQGLQVQNTVVIEGLNVTRPDGSSLFSIERLALAPGDRVAIMGHNGAGKTTLLKALNKAFQEQSRGPVRFNPQVTMGYYDQELAGFKPGATLFTHLRDHVDGNDASIRKELITAGFAYDRHDQKVDSLSGGERARLQFLALKLANPSVFLLDEPTNHIDVAGIEDLEEHLLDCPATTIFVSHDRRFVANVATRYMLIHEGKLVEIADPDDYYAAVLARADKQSSSVDSNSN